MTKRRTSKTARDADARAELLKALTPARPLPYDPEIARAAAVAFRRAWAGMDTARADVYRAVMPWYGEALAEADRSPDHEKQRAVEIEADAEWTEIVGLPPLTSDTNWRIAIATASAAGFLREDVARLQPNDAMPGLIAWAKATAEKYDAKFVGPQSPAQWCKHFRMSPKTFARMRDRGEVRVRKISTKSIKVHKDDVRVLTAGLSGH